MNANKTEARFDRQDKIEDIHFKELKSMSMGLLDRLSNVATRQDMLTLQQTISQLKLSQALPLACDTPPGPPTHTADPAPAPVVRTPVGVVRDCAQTVSDFVTAYTSNATPQRTTDVAKLLLAVAVATVCQATQRRTASSLAAPASSDEILHACLVACAILALLSSISHVPRLIDGLGDHKITMQTGLGEELKIPELYWKSHHTLHGYLQYYFENRPGRDWVVRKNYRFLIGGIGGMVIEETKWSAVLSRHTQLTMAFLLLEPKRCHKCRGVLRVKENNEKFWYVVGHLLGPS